MTLIFNKLRIGCLSLVSCTVTKSHFVLGNIPNDQSLILIYTQFFFESYSYRQSAGRISKMIRHHPRTPVQQAADWIEYTQAMGGLPHLRPRGLDLPFYQLYLLDVILVASALLVGAFAAFYSLIRCLCQVCFKSKPSKEKRN